MLTRPCTRPNSKAEAIATGPDPAAVGHNTDATGKSRHVGSYYSIGEKLSDSQAASIMPGWPRGDGRLTAKCMTAAVGRLNIPLSSLFCGADDGNRTRVFSLAASVNRGTRKFLKVL